MKTSMYTTEVNSEFEEKDILVIPDFINLQIWGEFLEMRRRMKRSLTIDGMKLLVGSLEKMRDHGEDVNAVLAQSVARSWIGVYPVKKP
jgi:hypothetical protein